MQQVISAHRRFRRDSGSVCDQHLNRYCIFASQPAPCVSYADCLWLKTAVCTQMHAIHADRGSSSMQSTFIKTQSRLHSPDLLYYNGPPVVTSASPTWRKKQIDIKTKTNMKTAAAQNPNLCCSRKCDPKSSYKGLSSTLSATSTKF